MQIDGKSRLANGLLKQSIAIVTLAILTLLTLDIMMDYKNHQDNAEQQLEQKLTLVRTAMASAVNDAEFKTTEQMLAQIMRDPRILKAYILTPDAERFGNVLRQQGVDDSVKGAERRLNLIHPDLDRLVGTLVLQIDERPLLGSFVKRSIAISSLSILLITLIGCFLYFLFEQKISRPFSEVLGHLNLAKQQGKLSEITPDAKHANNEIGHWLSLTNHLLDDLREERSKQSAAKAHASKLRRFDELTDLPNQEYFHQQLRQRIKVAASQEQKPVLMILGVDDFSDVNQQFGTEVGDKLLIAITKRINRLQTQNEFLARLSGDQFALLFEHVEHSYDAGRLAQSLLHSLTRPFSIDNHRVEISASIGIALYPQDARSAETLMACAAKAMREAKKEGRNQYQYYLASTDAHMRRRKKMEDALRNAARTGQLSLTYQPQFDLFAQQVSGAECLIRWYHPDFGQVSPDEFIPLAEKSNLIIPIGAWVLNNACEQLAEWQRSGQENFTMAVNVSAVQLKHPTLVSTVEQALKDSGIDPSTLVLEITETAVIDDINSSIDKLYELKKLGVKLALDDFGTGYSSLNYLKRLPIDKLKIDKSFLDEATDHHRDQLIIKSIVQLARNLELLVVAEGVEEYAQHEFLTDLKCAFGQGYFYSPPLKVKEFREMIFDSQFIDTTSNIHFRKRQSEIDDSYTRLSVDELAKEYNL